MAPGRRGLFVLLLVGIVVPGTILAVFGFRGLRQDRLLAERQSRDALGNAADLAAREVTRELARWPEWKEPDSAIITFTTDGRLQEANGLLWLPGGAPEPRLSAETERAEEAEIRQKDYVKALHLYEAALPGAVPEARAAILLRIARTARKSGDLAKAQAAWRRILSLAESPGTAAARLSLVEAGHAPALDLYRDLLAGRIPLARESYFFYSGRVKELLSAIDVGRLNEGERRGVALTEAAEAFLATPRHIPHRAMSLSGNGEGRLCFAACPPDEGRGGGHRRRDRASVTAVAASKSRRSPTAGRPAIAVATRGRAARSGSSRTGPA